MHLISRSLCDLENAWVVRDCGNYTGRLFVVDHYFFATIRESPQFESAFFVFGLDVGTARTSLHFVPSRHLVRLSLGRITVAAI